MDSGLGSDEDRKGRTKEQKQLRNQQLLSSCFIDAASLSDEAEVAEDQRRNDERRQGALVFQSAIPQFSMLQMSSSAPDCHSSNHPEFPEVGTPYNSIVHLDLEEEASCSKSPLGFYVDLNDVADVPKAPPSTSAKKNIFSMVIDFEGPKKDKPVKLSSSLATYRKNKQTKHLTLSARFVDNVNGNVNGSSSSGVSSIISLPGPSKRSDEDDFNVSVTNNVDVSSSSKSSSSGEFDPIRKSEQSGGGRNFEEICDRKTNDTLENVCDIVEKFEEKLEETDEKSSPEEVKENNIEDRPQFVKLSDLECQKPRLDLNFTPRMSKSIPPESSWVESPLLMSRSAGYRSAPHPMEPEPDNDQSDPETTETSRPKKSIRRLGTDLLRMFLEEIGPDVTVEVDGRKLKAHKCILVSRCQYFAAILGGKSSENAISLQGFSYESVHFALCHVYSGAAHVPDSISLVELASLADMLGLEGLKEVVEHALKQRHCHNFHKPCAGCCTGVLEVLPLSAAYGLDDLYQKCLAWITLHFVRVWPSRAFASLPRELREKCYRQHVVHMVPDRVLETVVACDKVLATLPSLRWAEPVTQLVLQLSDACHLYHRQHFAAVLASQSFQALDQGLGWSVAQIEDQLLSAASNLSIEQACKSYSKCCKMAEKSWSRPFNDLLYKIKVRLEQCLVAQSDRLIRSNAWLRLDTALRCRIKNLTPVSEVVAPPMSRLPKRVKTKVPSSPSSSDSSRNSSPGLAQSQARLHNGGGSPSLRRSLLLAARAPQVPPSPSTSRRSTLTQPTAASAAKSAPSKNLKNVKTVPRNVVANVNKPLVKKAGVLPVTSQTRTSLSTPNFKKTSQNVTNNALIKKANSRSSSPLKSDSRCGSPRKLDTVTSGSGGGRMKADVRTPSPRKRNVEVIVSPKKTVADPPVMQRSTTFLKDEPTVLVKNKN